MTINYKQLLTRLQEYRADPESILTDAEDIRIRALEKGVLSEKVHMRMDEGTVSVTERDPATALAAVRLKLEVIKWLQSRADLDTETSTACAIIIPGLDLTYQGEMKVYGTEA